MIVDIKGFLLFSLFAALMLIHSLMFKKIARDSILDSRPRVFNSYRHKTDGLIYFFKSNDQSKYCMFNNDKLINTTDLNICKKIFTEQNNDKLIEISQKQQFKNIICRLFNYNTTFTMYINQENKHLELYYSNHYEAPSFIFFLNDIPQTYKKIISNSNDEISITDIFKDIEKNISDMQCLQLNESGGIVAKINYLINKYKLNESVDIENIFKNDGKMETFFLYLVSGIFDGWTFYMFTEFLYGENDKGNYIIMDADEKWTVYKIIRQLILSRYNDEDSSKKMPISNDQIIFYWSGEYLKIIQQSSYNIKNNNHKFYFRKLSPKDSDNSFLRNFKELFNTRDRNIKVELRKHYSKENRKKDKMIKLYPVTNIDKGYLMEKFYKNSVILIYSEKHVAPESDSSKVVSYHIIV